MFNSNRDRYHAEYARRHYPVGTKIRLLAMNDPYDPVPGVDSFEVLERPAPAKSGKNRGAAR